MYRERKLDTLTFQLQKARAKGNQVNVKLLEEAIKQERLKLIKKEKEGGFSKKEKTPPVALPFN